MKIGIIILTLLLTANSLFAKDDNWQLTLANGDTISNISIQNLVSDSLVISQSGRMGWVNVDSIIEIKKIVESKFVLGAGIGVLAGTGLGALIANLSYKGTWFNNMEIAIGEVSGGVCGLLIGGIIGAAASEDEVYDLSGKTLKEKISIIVLRVISKE